MTLLKLAALSENQKLLVMLESFKLYSKKLYFGMTISKSSASFIVFPSVFVIHLVNNARVLNATRAVIFPAIVILRLTRM